MIGARRGYNWLDFSIAGPFRFHAAIVYHSYFSRLLICLFHALSFSPKRECFRLDVLLLEA
jgi:hypothetical protein